MNLKRIRENEREAEGKHMLEREYDSRGCNCERIVKVETSINLFIKEENGVIGWV